MLRYGDYPDPDALVSAVEGFMDEWNATEAHPFRWTYRGTPLVS